MSGDQDLADKLVRRRVRMATALGVVFLATQTVTAKEVDSFRLVDQVHIAAWAIWAGILILFLATGGGWFRTRGVRELMNDETTRDHRRRGFAAGFWAALAAAALLYGLTFVEPIGGREAARIIVTIAVSAALLRFAALERRSLRDA